ncbi:MAG TPA: Mur ligase family protein [Bacteroidia bacterium]|nr:Mur ligase family protein [Bacteroidia bacterium]HRS59121.1 Mur ligase family protein [Bacteroidia bacterium]
MRIHFISIGGSVMHSMAIAMYQQGHQVSGSDDEIFEPALGKLRRFGLLPPEKGWFAEKITKDIDIVVLGMHARADNPELLRAQELKLKIVSFPEFVYQNSVNKKRIVVAGSHGKTTITSMLMHVFRHCGKKFDYLVGSSVAGFENSFHLSNEADFIIIEGDEYLSSAINPEPKFLWYKPHLAIISGIAWDHYNVFPEFDQYVLQFKKFIGSMPAGGHLAYDENDETLLQIVAEYNHISKYPYTYPDYQLKNGKFYLTVQDGQMVELKLFGSHNLLNMNGARIICRLAGIEDKVFFEAIAGFQGAGKRLEKVYENENILIFRDFAHAPSKVKATISGIKAQFPAKKILACLELHTYSSLNREFLPQYRGSTRIADRCCIFINEEAVRLKGLKLLQRQEISEAFGDERLHVFYAKQQLTEFIKENLNGDDILLLMSSGNFDNLSVEEIISR